MSPDLKDIADKKNDLLLAEMGAWLHDYSKCSDENIAVQSSQPKNAQGLPKSYIDNLLPKPQIGISLFQKSISLNDLIKNGGGGDITDTSQDWIIRTMRRCHKAAHIEKKVSDDTGKQPSLNTLPSNPFGFELAPLQNLTNKLKSLPYSKITDRKVFLHALNTAFKEALGDTRRPENEITLWDWSSIVASLFKSALAAGALLGNKPEPRDLKWRLLALRMNSEQVWGNASKIPVLLERKEWLKKGLDNVKKLLEEEYPVGNEVYRDENGSIFVVPDIPDLLKIRDSRDNKTLGELISERLGYEGEIVVIPDLDEESWWGQDPDYIKKKNEGRTNDIKDEPPPIGRILSEEPYSPADAKAVQEWWNSTKQNPEICTISWLCPQGPTETGFNRKASDYWAEKVTGRARDWIEKDKLNNTIWVDEAADINGRICLIAGKIDLREWLKPHGYINTLLVKSPEKGAEPKTPSFARIFRVWETSKSFWEEIKNKFGEVNSVGTIPLRIRLIANYKQKTYSKKKPTINSAHQVELNGIRFSVFCAQDNEFLIIENILRLAKLMGAEKEHIKDYKSASNYVEKYISSKKILKIFAEEKSLNVRQIGELSVDKVEIDDTLFVPAIPILAEPSTFMAVVPANKALNVANAIKNKYELEMNKVRNRLPLTVGLVFAKSHTPISSIMDAGRRMLNITENDTTWKIKSKNPDKTDPGKIELTLNKNEQCIKVKVDTLMGDKTPDNWYPYWQVESDAGGQTPSNRMRQFIGHDKNIYVHVCDLQIGDKVKFTPSHFDFEFLDSAARRFEVSYKDGKRRDNRKSNRPYYLEDLSDFEKIRRIRRENLKRTQIKNMIGLIETKREEWQNDMDVKTFEAFVHDVIYNANWINRRPEEINEIKKAAVSGKLNDIVELYLDILKDKEEYNREEEST